MANLNKLLTRVSTEENYQALIEIAKSINSEYAELLEEPIKYVAVKKDVLRSQISAYIAFLLDKTETKTTESGITVEVTDNEIIVEETMYVISVEALMAAAELENLPVIETETTKTETEKTITVTRDSKYRVNIGEDSVYLSNVSGEIVSSIPHCVWQSLGVKIHAVFETAWIELNTPITIPTISEWLTSKGLSPDWTDTGRINEDCRFFSDSVNLHAINKDGVIITSAPIDSPFIRLEWFKVQDWAKWLGVKTSKKATGSGKETAGGKYTQTAEQKAKRGVQGEKQNQFVAWMREDARTVEEIQEFLGISPSTARDHLSYIKYWGYELARQGKGKYQIVG